MAESWAHKFGQKIGELIEDVIRPPLENFCHDQGLYLDYQKRKRPARRGKKVAWTDLYGNVHDLDFVIERGGTDSRIGEPVAFIESAWRRYTKHLRNKAQEIQGAILPLVEKYRWNNPFLGAVLAGFFTDGALEQLRSLGFQVLYFPYETIVRAFRREGFDMAFDEQTPDSAFRRILADIAKAPPNTLVRIRKQLVKSNRDAICGFFSSLEERLKRRLLRVIIIPLYGNTNEFHSIDAAVRFLEKHGAPVKRAAFYKYEIRVEFSNADKVEACFESPVKAREFLHLFTGTDK